MEQSKLGYYGNRWGCAATCLCSVPEEERGLSLGQKEVWTIIGKWVDTRSLLVSNYHNDTAPYLRDGFQNEWASFNDKSWHFFCCFGFEKPLHDVFDAIGMPKVLRNSYKLVEVVTQYSYTDNKGNWLGTHYVLDVNDGKKLINPDESLKIISRVREIDLHF